VKLPTISTDRKAEVGRVGEEKKRREKIRERVRRKNMQAREKVEKSRFTVFSNDLWLHGRKIGWLKRRVRSPGQMRD
jgi:hypothetical protein